jgi:ribose/xylose/arabinose/galactoside ABC-type transport system permease subunit
MQGQREKKGALARNLKTVHNLKAGNIILLFVGIQIVAIIAAVIFPEEFRYISATNIRVMLRAIPTLGIMVIGVNLLMISGEFDLSIGSNFAFSALVMAKLFNSGLPLFLSILVALGIGAFIGFLNGYLTTKSGVPSFIITLGAMMFWRGMLLLVSQAANEPFHPGPFLEKFFTASIGPFQVQFLWFVAVAVGGWFLLERHKLGNHFFAVGGNLKAAVALGINIKKTKITAFVILGILTALAGIISTTRVHSVSPIQGEGLELQAIAACVIGGTALMGGTGSILGAFLGATLLYTIQDFLLLLRAPGFYLKLFLGLIIVIAAILNQSLSSKGGNK